MLVGLGPGQIVSDGDPAPPPKRGDSAQLSADVRRGQTAGCIKMPLGMEGGLGLCDFALHGNPAPPQEKGGHSPAPNFQPTSIMTKRLDG